MAETLIRRLRKRHGELKTERQRGWEEHWREIGEQLAPYRHLIDDHKHQYNSGEKRDTAIYNSHPLEAVSTAVSGITASLINPAREWFSLEPANHNLRDRAAVRKKTSSRSGSRTSS